MATLLDKGPLLVERASNLRETDGLLGFEVESVREAEFLLEALLAIPNEALRKRVYAVALFSPSGLNARRAGEDWKTLGAPTGPALLLVPKGIASQVAGALEITWADLRSRRQIWLDRLQGLGCLAVLVAILLWFVIEKLR